MKKWDYKENEVTFKDQSAHPDEGEPKLEIFDELSEKIRNYFKKVDQLNEEDMKVTASKLDAKLAHQLRESGHDDTAQRILDLSVDETEQGKQKRRKLDMKLIYRPAFRWALTTFILVVLLSSGITYLLLNREGGNEIASIQNRQELPDITLAPTQLTDSGYVGESTSFVLNVASPIVGEPESALTIFPEVEYEVSVKDVDGGEQIEVKLKESLSKGQEVLVALREGTQFEDGSQLNRSIEWLYTVEPSFALLGTTPREGSSTVPVDSTIEFEFNHNNISSESIVEHLTISPKVDGRFELYGSKIVFLPNENMPGGRQYIVTLSSEFANNDGEKLGKDYTFKFTTSSYDSDGKYIAAPVLNWADRIYLINQSDGITATADWNGDSTNVTFKLYSVDPVEAAKLVSKGDFSTVPQSAKEVNSQILPNEELYKYKPASEGIYLLTASVAQSPVTLFRYVGYSKLAIVGGNEAENLSGYIYNFETAAPVSGVQISSYIDGQLVGDSKTDDSGKFTTKINSTALIQKDGQIGLYNPKYSLESFNIYTFSGEQPTRDSNLYAHIMLDLPIYKPGDSVHFKAYMQTVKDSQILPYNESKIQFISKLEYAEDGTGWDVKNVPLFEKETEVTGEFGTVAESFEVPLHAKAGYYSVTAMVDGKVVGRGSFRVAQYKKPVESYTMQFDKDRYFAGESAQIRINGNSYAGVPLEGKKLTVKLYSDELPSYAGEFDQVLDSGYIPLAVNSSLLTKEITLDSNGEALVSIGTTVPAGRPFRIYTAYLGGVDQQEALLARTSTLVAGPKTDIQLIGDSFSSLNAGEDYTIDMIAKEVWGGNPKPDSTFTINVERRWSVAIQEGNYYDEYLKVQRPRYRFESKQEVVVANKQLTTGKDGKIAETLKNLSYGTYQVTLSFEGFTKEYLPIYVSDPKFAIPNSDVELTLSPTKVSVGEEVGVQIKSTVASKGVLLVASSELTGSENVQLVNGDYSTKFKVTQNHFPQTRVCVFMIGSIDSPLGGKRYGWIHTCESLLIDSDQGILDVSISSDKELYKPGDEVTLNIESKNGDGKGVRSELAVEVVDQAVLDIVGDRILSRESIRDRIYNRLKQAMLLVIGNPSINPEGGFGAGGDTPRIESPDSAYRNYKVVTDQSGKATVKFTLPRSLTTWRVRTVAVSKNGEFGVGYAPLQVRQDLSISAKMPQFVRVGDQFDLDIELANRGGQPDSVIKIDCEGCVADPADIKVTQSSDTRKEYRALIQVDAVSDLKLTIALTQGDQVVDSIVYTSKVFTSLTPVVTVSNYVLQSDQEKLEVKLGVDGVLREDVAGLKVIVSKAFPISQFGSSVDAGLRSTRELSDSIMHNGLILLNYDKVKPTEDRAEFLSRIQFALPILLSNQAENGGFGTFDYDAVSVENSMMAAQAISSALANGIEVSNTVKVNLEKYLEQSVLNENLSLADRVLALRGLSYLSRSRTTVHIDQVRDLILADITWSKSPLTLSNLMIAYNNIKRSGDSLMLAKQLAQLVKVEEGQAHWEDLDTQFTQLAGNEYVTSTAYLALSPLEMWDLKDQVKLWLLANVQILTINPVTSREIVHVLASADIESVFDRNNQNTIQVAVNGANRGTLKFSEKDPFSKGVLNIASRTLVPDQNKITFTREGEGVLYLTALVSTFQESPKNSDSFTISKSYKELDTGQTVSPDAIKKGQVLMVTLTVTSKERYNNVIVTDYLPSGFNPVNTSFGLVSPDILRKFYHLEIGSQRYGLVAKDHVSFGMREVEKGGTYTFTYLVVAARSGEFVGTQVHAYVQATPTISSYIGGDKVKISE